MRGIFVFYRTINFFIELLTQVFLVSILTAQGGKLLATKSRKTMFIHWLESITTTFVTLL